MPQLTVRSDASSVLTTPQAGFLGELLGALSDTGQALFREAVRTRVARPKTVLVAEGEEPDEIGFVLGGTLAMTKVLSDGRGHVLGLLVPTEMYGRLFGGLSRYHIETLSDARLLCIRRTTLEGFLADEPAAERLYLIHTLDELDLAREAVLLLNGSKVISRVASFLVALLRRNSRLSPDAVPELLIHVPLSRAELASYLGTRPETLSRALHVLERMKVLRLLDPYRLELTDLPALLRVSGQDLTPSDLALLRSPPTRPA